MDKIAVIGLGYVGLPLAIEFGKKLNVVGFDINLLRVKELQNGFDKTLEIDSDDFKKASSIIFSSNPKDLADCNIYIITVPTPIDSNKKPNLGPLKEASSLIAGYINDGNIVIYESTVYPGATEEICVPILEHSSGLIFNKDFFCGYSPERINPGDKDHRLSTIIKVTSGSNPATLDKIDALYKKIIVAGTHKVSSIKIAEAAKVIENTQRDVNIALINELALLFDKLDIDTEEVLEASGTKWNFLPFKPGLVGGHCIGVDPYYLTHKAAKVNYLPEMILAGRRLNDNMGQNIVNQILLLMRKKSIQSLGANVLIMGLTFKEDCPDIRNTRVIDIVNEFKKNGSTVDVFDPWVNKPDVVYEYNIETINKIEKNYYDVIVLAVAHKNFKDLGVTEIKSYGRKKHVLYDVKSIFKKTEVDGRL